MSKAAGTSGSFYLSCYFNVIFSYSVKHLDLLLNLRKRISPVLLTSTVSFIHVANGRGEEKCMNFTVFRISKYKNRTLCEPKELSFQ